VVVLAPHLDEAEGAELIEEALCMSKRQVERLVAERRPPRGGTQQAESRVKLELWVSEETLAIFEKARDLDRHIDPSGDSSKLLSRMAHGYIERREKERFAVTDRPRAVRPRAAAPSRRSAAPSKPPASSKPTSAAPSKPPGKPTAPGRKNTAGISAATRREVYRRDGERCTFVAPDGTRCSSTAFLEFDHAVPRALGGGNEVGNLRLLCRPHNGRAAEQLLGADRMARAKMVADAKSGLVNLGFSRREAEAAVGRGEGETLEAVVRSALRSRPRP
jgi:hypothetical protein